MDRLRPGQEEELGARENVFIVLDTLQRGRLSVSFGLKYEALQLPHVHLKVKQFTCYSLPHQS